MTGADSPVIADSSTEAMPSTTSPSPGISSPGVTTHRSPTCSCGGRHLDDRPVGLADDGHGLRAGPAQGVGLGLAPPFGHRLGEVGEQHGEPQPHRHQARRRRCRPSWPIRQVAEEQDRREDAADHTTNITGLRSCWRGSSFLKASQDGPAHDGGLEHRLGGPGPDLGRAGLRGRPGLPCGGGEAAHDGSLELPDEVFDDRSERHDREVGQPDDDDHHAEEQAAEQRAAGGERAGRGRDVLLAARASRRWPAPGPWAAGGRRAW